MKSVENEKKGTAACGLLAQYQEALLEKRNKDDYDRNRRIYLQIISPKNSVITDHKMDDKILAPD